MPGRAHVGILDITVESDLKRIFNIVLKRGHMVAFFVLIAGSASLIYTSKQIPVYKASSRLLIETGASKVVKNEDVELSSLRDNMLYLNSQIEILKSNFIARRVMEETGAYEPWDYRLWRPDQKPLPPLQDKDRIVAMLKKLKVRLLPRTQILEISFEDIDPKLAERITNAWIYAYINFPTDSNVAVNQKANEGIGRASQKAKIQLEEAQRKFDDYRKEHHLTVADDQELSASDETTLLGQLLKKKSELEVQLAQQLNYLKEKHPIIIGLRAEFKSIEQEIQNQSSVKEKTVQYSILKREVETSRAVYESFMNRVLHTEAIEGLKSNVKIVDEAQAPKKPVRPKKALSFLISILAGLFGGIAVAFGFEALDVSIKTPDEIKDILHLPFLGVIPLAPGSKGIGAWRGGKARKILLKDFEDHFSPISESYRSLRTSIIFSSADMKKKTFLVTSAGPQEGKSTTVTNLAIVMAQAGERTLLIDADFRRPNVHNFFNFENEKGLTDIFADEKQELFSCIRPTEIPNLDVLVCGTIPPNPSELLGSSKMEWITGELIKIYDKVIFDTPPVLAATDAVVLSTKVESTVLIVKANQTHKQAALRAKELIEGAGSKIIGAVLNMVEPKKRPGYYDYYYYSYYGTYGKDKKKKSSGKKETKELSHSSPRATS